MNDTRTALPLASLVSGAASAAVLDGFGLDYCCGGRQALGEACQERGVDPAVVLGALDAIAASAATGDRAWATMGPAELVDHLEATHHVWLRGSLERAVPLAAKVANVHGERHPELVQVQLVVGELSADLLPHLVKEERVLFPMIRELAAADEAPTFHCGSLQHPIRVMGMEHDRAGELLADLRALTGGYEPPADACASYRMLYEELDALEADTHLHVHKENNLLFPAVVALEERLGAA